MSKALSYPAIPFYRTLKHLLSLLDRCSSIEHICRLHAKLLKEKFAGDSFLLTRLAHAYIRSGNVASAKQILRRVMKSPPLFLWNETIKGFARNGHFRKSIDLYYEMTGGSNGRGGIQPNEFTFTFVLPACSGERSFSDGRKIHRDIFRWNYESNIFVATALVDMYGKCGELRIARQVFDRMSSRGTATYNAMICGYVINEEYEQAMQIFNQMQRFEIQFDTMTMVSVLQACASLGGLQQGRWVHGQVVRTQMEMNVYLGAALIHMYAKCGSIDDSNGVFNEMPKKDLICWTAIISAYGMHGHAEIVESLFDHMLQAGIRPDAVTFVGILSGFSHKGMVDEGMQYFKRMSEDFNVSPDLEHYSCMVDMLGRAGRLEDAERLVRVMPMEPDSSMWGGLLNACRVHRKVEFGKKVFEELLRMGSRNPGWYVLMANIYAAEKEWDGVAKVRSMMKYRNLMKHPGWSFVELGGQVHRFVTFDHSHPSSKEICQVLKGLVNAMEIEGYFEETNCVFGEWDENLKNTYTDPATDVTCLWGLGRQHGAVEDNLEL